jgi:hypothetical protein
MQYKILSTFCQNLSKYEGVEGDFSARNVFCNVRISPSPLIFVLLYIEIAC